jgi:septum formation protein
MPRPTPIRLILASTSPYRKELLERLQIPFEVCNPKTDETALPSESATNLALRLAQAKAQAVAAEYRNALIIGSDQVAVANGKIYGKPGNHENAVIQLQALRGQTVNFFTALCLLDTRNNTAQVTGVPTLVKFRNLSDCEIENYLCKEQPYQCAGAAKSEGLGVTLLESMTGDDPTALIGLPLIALCHQLRQAGVNIL